MPTTAAREAVNHRAVSDTLLVNAQIELDRGDDLQASEKSWGALVHYVKAIAEERGWQNEHHADVMRIAQALVSVTEAPARQRERLGTVRFLHVNFYEDEMDAATVQSGINASTKLLAALKAAESSFPTQEPPHKRVPYEVRAARDRPR